MTKRKQVKRINRDRVTQPHYKGFLFSVSKLFFFLNTQSDPAVFRGKWYNLKEIQFFHCKKKKILLGVNFRSGSADEG